MSFSCVGIRRQALLIGYKVKFHLFLVAPAMIFQNVTAHVALPIDFGASVNGLPPCVRERRARHSLLSALPHRARGPPQARRARAPGRAAAHPAR